VGDSDLDRQSLRKKSFADDTQLWRRAAASEVSADRTKPLRLSKSRSNSPSYKRPESRILHIETSPISKGDAFSTKTTHPLRDAGGYVKHPDRGPDVFLGKPKRELVSQVEDSFNKSQRVDQINRSNHILELAR